MPINTNLEAKQLESYFKEIMDQVKTTDFKIMQSKELDPLDVVDLRQVQEAFELKDDVLCKTAVFEFIQNSIDRGRSPNRMAELLGWHHSVLERYLADYWDWSNGLLGNSNLRSQIFHSAVNNYKLACQKLNCLVDLMYMRLNDAIRNKVDPQVENLYFKNTIKACEALANVQTKYQEFYLKVGMYDNFKQDFLKPKDPHEFNLGQDFMMDLITDLEKRGITREGLNRIQARLKAKDIEESEFLGEDEV